MIDIRPDPSHPRGGFALLTLPQTSAPEDPVQVAVFNSYLQKWLGPAGWQPNRTALPARTAQQDGAALTLTLGPDIVNHLEEDTPLRIEAAGGAWDIYWPDTINAGPDLAVVGGIGGTGTAPQPQQPTLAEAPPAGPEPDPEPVETAAEAGATGEAAEDAAQDSPNSRRPLILAALLLAAALAAAAYFLMQPAPQDDPEPEPAPAPAPEPQPQAVAPDPCTEAGLAAIEGGFAALAGQLRSCGSAVTADAALGHLERAAAANDADALALFGAIYDGEVTDEAIETQIGLSFPDQPPRAAEYYARAAAAGSAEAETRLAAICTRLQNAPDTLSQSAHEDHCQ